MRKEKYCDMTITDCESAQRLIDCAREARPKPLVYMLVWFGVVWGMPLRDLMRLRVGEVVARRRFTVWDDKDRRYIELRLSPEERNTFRELLSGRNRGELLFYGGDEAGGMTERLLNGWVRRVCKKAGIGDNVKGYDTLINTHQEMKMQEIRERMRGEQTDFIL